MGRAIRVTKNFTGKSIFISLACLSIFFFFSSIPEARATTISFTALDSGSFSNHGEKSGYHIDSNGNVTATYFSGSGGATWFRSYFIFDLGTIGQPITAASFQIAFNSVTADGIFSLYNVSTPIEVLQGESYPSSYGPSDVYNDLGEGEFFGQIETLMYSDPPGWVYDIQLTQIASELMSASTGLFVLGGSFDNYVPYSYETAEGVFGGLTISQFAPTLTLTLQDAAPVPEPGTLVLLGSGLAGLALYRRRMNKA